MKERTRDLKKARYAVLWRWHFYAGIIVAPFLIFLAITGGAYLFQPQIDEYIYKDYYEITPDGSKLSANELLNSVKERYPEASVSSFRPGENVNRSSEVGISLDNTSYIVFINPYNAEEIAKIDSSKMLTNVIKKLHGELMIGTIGDRIVELMTCWAIVLIVTGIYLWFPRKKKGMAGVLYPRVKNGKKIFRRDLHAVPAFWVTAGMLFLIMTGLPWSGFWGTNFQTIVTNQGLGYPPSIWTGDAPTSVTQTKDIADVPWAAENLIVPESTVQDYLPLSIDDLMLIAEREGIDPSYTIYLPQSKEGVYTFSAFTARAQDEMTMHIDQYSGAILTNYGFENYELVGKLIAWGITLHEGTQFGIYNQIIGLIICMGIILTAASGFYLWIKRKPKNTMGSPKSPSVFNIKGFVFILVILGVIFPLIGFSILFILLIDWLIIKRVPALKKFFNV